ncbi:serpin family protein [Geomonas oryzae]|uniref:serpin family protein n=1 Tax=Geomonas oryzae TaxID=2364273 RepID=UPI0013A5EF38|nr:serpin family protein [Geomonas oryzae]
MAKAIRAAVAVIFALSLLAPAAMADDQAVITSIANANNAFALDLYAKLRKETGNLFFSPYSISSALAMTYGGAKGDTAAEMAKTLHFSADPVKTGAAFAIHNNRLKEIQKKGNVKLLIANSLWPQNDHSLRPEYLSLIEKFYGSSVMPVDYKRDPEKARRRINEWVETKTQGLIKDIITAPLPRTTSMALVNAIYFKGRWSQQFDPKRTFTGDFTRIDGSKTKVPMMRQNGRFGYNETKDAKLLELPYVGGQLSMTVILPHDDSQLPGLESQLAAVNLEAWLSGIEKRPVDVELPKFKMQWGSFNLVKPLQKLGIRKAFEEQADFSGMDGKKGFVIQRVLHKAFVEVNEEGTEASAATAATVMLTGRPTKAKSFKADHPFLFAIRETETGNILFFGRVLDPKAM